MTCERICECAFNCNDAISQTYCSDNPMLCARRRVALTVGGDSVPEDLLPEQYERVLDVLFTNQQNLQGV